ncbi:MAG: POTRA domain-containing protein, partial [Myxococcota bacterium]|nr:POTRA domain-containing protein [Myxococcota bacterium]
ISSFAVLNDADIKHNVQNLRDKYVEKGFYLAQIDPKIEEVESDLVDLTFEITENRKVVVQSLEITGNDHLPDRKVRRFLQTKQGGIVPWLTGAGTFDELNLENDVQIVRSVFMEEGFVDVEVSPPKVYLSPDKRFIYITIHVNEGPLYTIGSVRTQGDFVAEEGLTEGAVLQVAAGDTAETVRDRWESSRSDGWDTPRERGLVTLGERHPPLTPGDTFKLTTLQVTMQEISDLYGDQGYAFVNVVPLTETDAETRIVDITFDIQKGEKVRIGRIDIAGNDPTFDKVIRREIPINEGETYAGSSIQEGRERLQRLGFFEDVRISTPRGSASDVLDMKVEVVEQPTGSFSVGAGFSSLEDFLFTTNVSKNNFLGLGYVMSAAANISSKRQQWNVSMFDPYFLDSRWTLKVDGYSIARSFMENEYQRGGAMAVGRYLDPRDDVRLVFDYTMEDSGLTSLDAYKKRLLGGQLYRNGLTSTGGLSLNIDKRNNRINATRGIFSSLSADLSGGFLQDDGTILSLFGGDFNFYELKLNFRGYHPVSPTGDWL